MFKVAHSSLKKRLSQTVFLGLENTVLYGVY